jgi:hypothetical protein
MSKWLRTGTRMLTIEIAILALFIVPAAIYAAATISKTPTTNSPTSLQSGLVGHWTFDGGDMLANVADKSGQGNAGRLIGFTATTTVAGTVGGALAFNGTSNYVSVSSSVNTSAVSFWVKPSSATNYVLDLDGGTHYVWINNGIVTATGFSSPTIYVNNAVTSAIAPNVWSHVVVTTGTSFSASAITLGKQSSNYFAGSLDDTRLYNRVLSAD